MNNGNMPASPTTGLCEQCCMTNNSKQEYQGLTKREAFAMAAMQGLVSSEYGYHQSNQAIAERSIDIAGALLKELEK